MGLVSNRRRTSTALALAALMALPATAQAEPQWAPVDQAKIRPGVQVLTGGSQCTANFVFYDATHVYLGYAAHCATVPPDGGGPVHFAAQCGDPSYPVGTAVEVEGATRTAKLAYSSYDTMHRVKEEDGRTCGANDFALVRLDPADAASVNPTVPLSGGPTGLRQGVATTGEKVLSYGNSSLRGGIEQLKPREGWVTNENTEWEYSAYFATIGVFGDSGSAVMDAAGSASGVLVAISSVPPGTNVTVDLSHLLGYMRAHTDIEARLANGTETFTGPVLGPGAVDPPAPQPDPQPEPGAQPKPAPSSPQGAGTPPVGAEPATAQEPGASPSATWSVRVVGRPSRRGRALLLRLASTESVRGVALRLQARGRLVARGWLEELHGERTIRLKARRPIRAGFYRLLVRAADGRSVALRLRLR